MTTTSRRAHPTMFGLASHAAVYDRAVGVVMRRSYRLIAADVDRLCLPAGATVLDVGTGPGRLPRLIAQQSPELIIQGVDLSPEMVTHATTAAASAGLGPERLRYSRADVADLPFADGSTDLVVSSLSLHHWERPAEGLREIVRILRPGGQAWVYDVRSALDRVADDARAACEFVRVEQRLAGAGRLNPLGRLILEPGSPRIAES